MDLQLNGKTAVVTGSTAGIGLAIAMVLAQEGAAVVVNAIPLIVAANAGLVTSRDLPLSFFSSETSPD